jgi:hypothetical protein
MTSLQTFALGAAVAATLFVASISGDAASPQTPGSAQQSRPLRVTPVPIASDASVRYDYDIVYVRAPRHGDDVQMSWSDVFAPLQGEPGSDLMLLHPDGSEDVLVAAGEQHAITAPVVSFDGQSVYYARIDFVSPMSSDLRVSHSSDIFRIDVKTRRVEQLTHQEFTPNTGVADPALPAPGVYNLDPCPLPGGRVVFTSSRNGFVSTKDYRAWASKPGYPGSSALQLFVMDDHGGNVEEIGYLNINGALNPTILKDGRVMFSSFESQGLHDVRVWGIWTIHPDGTKWQPLASAFAVAGNSARHFLTQLSDGHVVFEEYYFEANLGFGTFFKVAPGPLDGEPFFGSASKNDPRNYDLKPFGRVSFSPQGLELLTPFAHFFNAPAYRSDAKDPKSPYNGKLTHPSGAPDNDLLAVWSPGPVYGLSDGNHSLTGPAIDSGLYLIKHGEKVEEPAQLLLIKNDPKFNEQWPRALVPYARVHGVAEPAYLPAVSNDGTASPDLPEGTPFGVLGSSSLYKRESYPLGVVPEGAVTAKYAGGDDPYAGLGGLSWFTSFGNWFSQGADAGQYDNSDIHAIRILIDEPTTDPRHAGRTIRRWWNASNERLRILGEFPVRKFSGGIQPTDPDGNPDTSFQVKLPADVAWTIQTLDKHGMVLNSAQTWHQLRPGEVRNDCGGCHAHSQRPTPFADTAAARPEYRPFDLTRATPLLTSKRGDQSGRQWDARDETGVRFQPGVVNVEYFRDVKPILDRSCTACHSKTWRAPAGNLVLDDDVPVKVEDDFVTIFAASPPAKVPGTFMRLAMDQHAVYGNKSPLGMPLNRTGGWAHPQASRYIRLFQSRRSLLVWKIFGERLDGFRNEDFAYETIPGDPASLVFRGAPYAITGPWARPRWELERPYGLAYLGSQMPPPAAVAGTYTGPDGRAIKVPPLTDEDRRTIVRWIDLGCPIDLEAVPARTGGHGWAEDDTRPTLALTSPRAGVNASLTRILIGMHDYDSGLAPSSLRVVADFEIDGVPAGQNLASKFKLKSPGVQELVFAKPVSRLAKGTLTVSVHDKAGNVARIDRAFSIAP